MQDFTDAVAVVTGAASGIGGSRSEELARRGARVVLVGSTVPARVIAPRISARVTSVSSSTSRTRTGSRGWQIESATNSSGATLLVNNAGAAGPGGMPVRQATPDDWEQVLGVNLRGVVNGLRAFVPQLLAAEQNGRSPHLMTTASPSELVTFPFTEPCTASKHAAVALTEQVAAELAARGSRIG